MRSLFFGFFPFFVFLGALSAGETDWKETLWRGEKAWESSSEGWTAIVSEERSRLVSLLADKNGPNLLFETAKVKDVISWGGHRCWLGPQSKWFSDWPPPPDWEESAADHVSAVGSVLTITQAHKDARYPVLTRSYQWKSGVLHCRVLWQGGAHHAIQIMQLPKWAIIHVNRGPTTDFPLGYGMPQTSGPVETRADLPLDKGISQMDGNSVTLWHANISGKVAFPPQEIVAEIGDWRLKMRRGATMGGTNSSAPDHGLLTQVFVGDRFNPFIEIEQLSAYATDGPGEFEVLLEPIRPGTP